MEKRKLLTVIAEAIVEREIVAVLDELGVSGYTVAEARGKGHHGLRSSSWDSVSNVRVEIVCDERTALAVAERLQKDYSDDFAMIMFLANVEVFRPNRF